LQPVALPFPEIIAIAVLGWGCEPQSGVGLENPQGVEDGTVRKSVCELESCANDLQATDLANGEKKPEKQCADFF